MLCLLRLGWTNIHANYPFPDLRRYFLCLPRVEQTGGFKMLQIFSLSPCRPPALCPLPSFLWPLLPILSTITSAPAGLAVNTTADHAGDLYAGLSPVARHRDSCRHCPCNCRLYFRHEVCTNRYYCWMRREAGQVFRPCLFGLLLQLKARPEVLLSFMYKREK